MAAQRCAENSTSTRQSFAPFVFWLQFRRAMVRAVAESGASAIQPNSMLLPTAIAPHFSAACARPAEQTPIETASITASKIFRRVKGISHASERAVLLDACSSEPYQ